MGPLVQTIIWPESPYTMCVAVERPDFSDEVQLLADKFLSWQWVTHT